MARWLGRQPTSAISSRSSTPHLYGRSLVHLHAFEHQGDLAVAARGQGPQKVDAGCGVEAALQDHPAAAAFVGDGRQYQGCAGQSCCGSKYLYGRCALQRRSAGGSRYAAFMGSVRVEAFQPDQHFNGE